ncbi:Lar family restriction alleviation protein [Pseudomonas serbica]|uniref:Lar family restriction alleviation protein n=1 Tax=Pseudomonas serbica TaxID=2965074 RepID=UPI00237B723C|nr:Lar family restriction alleviation protein [Pseudomonas serbica]
MNASIEISKELAPCPFCQSSNVHLTRDMYDTEEGRRERAQIRCWGCQLLTKTFKSNSEAVAYWNTRAAPVVERQEPLPGDCEPFQKWVMATKHPVFGFLDDRSLARSDDLQGYADEYVQGLWVAYKEFALRPEPVSVVTEKLKQAVHDSAHAETEEQRVTALAYWLDQQVFESGMLSCAAATLLSYLDRFKELPCPVPVVKQTTWADVQPWYEANEQMLRDVCRFEGLKGAALEVWRAAVSQPAPLAAGQNKTGNTHEQ